MAKEIVGNKFEIGDYKFQKGNYKVKSRNIKFVKKIRKEFADNGYKGNVKEYID